jgi:hypothetical protein
MSTWCSLPRDVRLTTRLRISAGVNYPPNIPSWHTHMNKFTSYPYLSSFFTFTLGTAASSQVLWHTMATTTGQLVSVFPCNSAYLILHKSHENLLLLSISEQYLLTNDEACQERSELSLHILSLSSCKGCELFTKTLTSSEKPTNNNHKIQGASASEL